MFWKNPLNFLKEWSIIGLLFAPFIILCFLDLSGNTTDNFDSFKDKVEFLSWIFASIMALVTFSTLFVAFTYENKLIVASKNHKSVLKPYTLATEDLRNALINYQNSINEDKILKFIFYGFILISFFSMLIWGTAVAVYTNFRFSFSIDLTIGSLLVFGIYAFYLILFIILLLITIAIKLILLNKNPLDKGYLPSASKICDVNYLLENKGDINEFFTKSPITLEFFKNPVGSNSFKYEVNLNLPINISNLKYVIKVYDGNNKILVTFYGKTKNVIMDYEIGDRYSKVITESFSEELYKTLQIDNNCYGICKIFDKDNKVIPRYSVIKAVANNNNLYLTIAKTVNTESKIDHDGNLIKINEVKSDFCKYQIESGRIE
ncbi:hypothetical protein ACFQ9Y_05805 [Peribacillus simplex]|uniref:hypothetical protein n=1 Tax=Peribacillus simplex TaxID=1478 RepID=UPI00366E6DB6